MKLLYWILNYRLIEVTPIWFTWIKKSNWCFFKAKFVIHRVTWSYTNLTVMNLKVNLKTKLFILHFHWHSESSVFAQFLYTGFSGHTNINIIIITDSSLTTETEEVNQTDCKNWPEHPEKANKSCRKVEVEL